MEMLPVFKTMHRAGVPLLAGTDAGATNVAHGGVARAVLSLHREVGLDLVDALWSATTVPANALGLGATAGALAPGLSADFMLLEGDLRAEPDLLLCPATVWARGRVAASAGLPII